MKIIVRAVRRHYQHENFFTKGMIALQHFAKPLGRGDIIFASNEPKPLLNNEQKGVRPWLVVSVKTLNKMTSFVWAVPFTSKGKGHPLEVEWTENTKTQGFVLCDQLTTLDVRHRKYSFVEHADIPTEVMEKIQAVLGFK